MGFDLDMTLFDTRPGIKATFERLAAETGIAFDADLIVTRLGPPLAFEMANWVPEERVEELCDHYRRLYPTTAVASSLPMPGAKDAIEAVRAAGGRTMVVTAKTGVHAQRHVDHAALPVDVVVGGLWGTGKGSALSAEGAAVYVGDHVLDIQGARAADAVAVAVASGPCSVDELSEAGADVVLESLTEFPAWWESFVLDRRLTLLESELRAYGSAMVAFSGGADSAFLLAAAVRALGAEKVAAATAISDSLPAAELDDARRFAAELGVELLTPRTNEIEREGYRRNDGDRCYFCKAELVEVLTPVARQRGLAVVATGTNADDVRAGFRPGIRAADERGAVTPLLAAGLTKAQIRSASYAWGLRTWDKPAAACLSSRVAYGLEVTSMRLGRIERAESAVRAVLTGAGYPKLSLRVRDLGEDARIEIDPAHLEPVTDDEQLAAAVVAAALEAGFESAFIDPQGFRSGAMNELLPDPDHYR